MPILPSRQPLCQPELGTCGIFFISSLMKNDIFHIFCQVNPLLPDAHYSERQDKPFSLQIQRLEVDLKLNCGFLFFAPWELMG